MKKTKNKMGAPPSSIPFFGKDRVGILGANPANHSQCPRGTSWNNAMYAASIKLAETAGPPTTLRFGRDDNTVGGIFEMRLAETGD